MSKPLIYKADFIKSATKTGEFLLDKPQILFLGRSNVGKSSLINCLTNRKNLARVSATPGRTITLNYYLINDTMYFVDAPGYGYARRSKAAKSTFISMINEALKTISFKCICILVDFKVGPTASDIEVYRFLLNSGHNVVIIATKKDKVNRSNQYKNAKIIENIFLECDKIFMVSSTIKEGILELTEYLLE